MKSKWKYEIIIYWSDEDQTYIAEVPELPGCAADGPTYKQALANIEVLIREWIDTASELNRSIPQPVIRRRNRPRTGWAAAARRMRERGEDGLLDAGLPGDLPRGQGQPVLDVRCARTKQSSDNRNRTVQMESDVWVDA